jgi:hypothetical protein
MLSYNGGFDLGSISQEKSGSSAHLDVCFRGFLRRLLTGLSNFHDSFCWDFGWRLVLHASILQHVGPFPTRTGVTVFEMLAEMICSKELFGLVAFAEFMDVGQMLDSIIPVTGRIRKLFATVAAGIA